jgi:hypothetical protein
MNFSKKIDQKGFIPVILVFVVLGIAIFSAIVWYYSWELKNPQNQVEADESARIYYSNLRKKCESVSSPNCCIASLNSMKARGYVLAQDNGDCPKGYSLNMLRCPDSYKWCVYIGDESYSDKPDVIGNFTDCVRAGYPVLETFPAQCKAPDGRTFIEGQKSQ